MDAYDLPAGMTDRISFPRKRTCKEVKPAAPTRLGQGPSDRSAYHADRTRPSWRSSKRLAVRGAALGRSSSDSSLRGSPPQEQLSSATLPATGRSGCAPARANPRWLSHHLVTGSPQGRAVRERCLGGGDYDLPYLAGRTSQLSPDHLSREPFGLKLGHSRPHSRMRPVHLWRYREKPRSKIADRRAADHKGPHAQ